MTYQFGELVHEDDNTITIRFKESSPLKALLNLKKFGDKYKNKVRFDDFTVIWRRK
jgi:hypothetical protein